jgi:hypothetical protein
MMDCAEMTPQAFDEMIAELVRRGLPAEYAALIGDVIEEDVNGKWIVRDQTGKIIDRIDPL